MRSICKSRCFSEINYLNYSQCKELSAHSLSWPVFSSQAYVIAIGAGATIDGFLQVLRREGITEDYQTLHCVIVIVAGAVMLYTSLAW